MLLANGHPEAPDYPLSLLSEHSQLVVERRNIELANSAISMQMVAGAVMGSGKEGAKAFKEWIDRLTDG